MQEIPHFDFFHGKPWKSHPFVSMFTELLHVPAPGGREDLIAELIRDKITKLGHCCETDPSGNLIVRIEGRNPEAPTVILAAHMDEIAMVVSKIETDGSLRVRPSGGLLPWKTGEIPVEILGDNHNLGGVLSMGSTHNLEALNKTALGWADVKIITGMTKTGLSEAGVRPGSTAVPARDIRGPYFMGDPSDPLISAWSFDDRAGCVTLIRLLNELKNRAIKPYHPTLVCFTVNEEIGCHGAKNLCFREKPEVFVAVDGCPVIDDDLTQLDGRPGIWSKDSQTNYDQRLLRDFLTLAKEAGTDLQVMTFERAGSDAGAVHSCGLAPRVAIIGHVRANSHGFDIARLSCFDNSLAVVLKFCEQWR